LSIKRIAWAITGAGHTLEECIDALLRHERVDVFLSLAAEEVLQMYNLHKRINVPDLLIYRETQASSPQVARFSGGAYCVLIVAPATSNSVAKFVHGISDSLVTNLFAQAGKSKVPVIVYPTDLRPALNSVSPHGEPIEVFPRPIDLENTGKLETFSGVTMVADLEELEKCLAAYL
jgi:dihydromethanopterin reductase (acceptor)